MQAKPREGEAAEEIANRCDQCGRALPGGPWFARLHRGGRTVKFCRPRCLEAFLRPAAQEDEFEYRYAPMPAAG